MADTGVLPILPVQNACVLLVDNDVVTQKTVEAAFCRTKCAVDTEPDVVAAMKVVMDRSHTERPVKIVLISFDRPEIHGFRLASCLRAAGFDIPIVAVSATMTRQQCLVSGATHFLPKPIDSADLLDLVSEYVDD